MNDEKVLAVPKVERFKIKDGGEASITVKQWSRETAQRIADRVKGRPNYIVVRKPADADRLQARVERLAEQFGTVHVVFAWDDDIEDVNEGSNEE